MYTHASQVNQNEYISNITYDEISNLSWFTQLFHWFKGCSTGYFKDFLFLFCLVCSEPDWLPYFVWYAVSLIDDWLLYFVFVTLNLSVLIHPVTKPYTCSLFHRLSETLGNWSYQQVPPVIILLECLLHVDALSDLSMWPCLTPFMQVYTDKNTVDSNTM